MPDNGTLCYSEEDPLSNPTGRSGFHEIFSEAMNRRKSLTRLAGWIGATTLGLGGPTPGSAASSIRPPRLTFPELNRGLDETARVADGYRWQVLAAWGDPLFEDAPQLDVWNQSGESQLRQFGYNCDYIAFIPLPREGQVDRALLCVNHEYVNANLMFPGLRTRADLIAMPRHLVEAEMAAIGHSVIEIERRAGDDWKLNRRGKRNRRISPLSTPMRLSGPAAGHARLKTSEDSTGRHVLGTLNNCGGGVTPWGTMLICEENFNVVFSGAADSTPESRNHKRYAVDGQSRFNPAWATHFPRFNLELEPNEPNRFGWVVEFDPHDPESVPVKRTALGRMKHEGAGIVTNHDGRIVIYCGDDERFEYVYRFVTHGTFDASRPEAARDLLDDGTLSVARFDSDGSVNWLPLVFGQGPLTGKNGFESQADVVIEARRAADLLGATPMDRPEDVEPSPVNGRIYVILSNNSKRLPGQVDAANPRAENVHGHVLELTPPLAAGGLDHTADRFDWTVFLRAGNPSNHRDQARCHSEVSDAGWISCPDNGAFDSRGRFWLTTDGASETAGTAEGIYVCEVDGEDRARTRLFLQGPRGSELTGVCLSPDDRSLFVSIQHPGEEEGSEFASPSTRWPDFDPLHPPRPAVVIVNQNDGLPVGS